MGKNKELYKTCKRVYNEALSVAEDTNKAGFYILENWVPEKNLGLSKKESRAAYVGFALGLINASAMFEQGEFGLLDCGPVRVFDWLCSTVASYRDCDDDFDAFINGLNDDQCLARFFAGYGDADADGIDGDDDDNDNDNDNVVDFEKFLADLAAIAGIASDDE